MRKIYLIILVVIAIGLTAVILHQCSGQAAPQQEQAVEVSGEQPTPDEEPILEFKDRRLEITAYKAKYIDPEILRCIIDIADTVQTLNYKRSIAAVDSMRRAVERGDSLDGSVAGVVDPIHGTYLVVVNNLYERKQHGFSFHFLSSGDLSPRIYDSERWSINRVKKYGYTEILGYNILLVDDKAWREYFTVDMSCPKQFVLVDNGNDMDGVVGIFESLGGFYYREDHGKLICVGKHILRH